MLMESRVKSALLAAEVNFSDFLCVKKGCKIMRSDCVKKQLKNECSQTLHNSPLFKSEFAMMISL